jgi:hypothetical protein
MGTTVVLVSLLMVLLSLEYPWRLFRNYVFNSAPSELGPQYSLINVSNVVTLVVSVKDTCSQTPTMLTALAAKVSTLPLIFTHPDFKGCNTVSLSATKLFARTITITLAHNSSPFTGFLKARPHIMTKYALFLHNDVYIMDEYTISELVGALSEHPEAAFAAPHIYESGSNGVIVPHGHHSSLCINNEGFVDYSLSFDLLTRRSAHDFKHVVSGYPQMDFMEDHAFMGRTDTYSNYLDENASFTLEHIDSILTQRLKGTFPWYVPSARVIFNVDSKRIGWQDIPYFSFKRSNTLGSNVVEYLEQKWGVHFPLSGMWDYLRYDMLANKVLIGSELPMEWEQQRVLYYSWFASIGFTLFNNESFDDFVHQDVIPYKTIELSVTPVSRRPKNTERKHFILDKCADSAATLTDLPPMFPRFNVSTSCNSDECGMLIVEDNSCMCYNNALRLKKSMIDVEAMLYRLKLPGRAFKYKQLKRMLTTAPRTAQMYQIPSFESTHSMVQWKW